MTDDEIDALEDKVPAVAIAALNAASEAARNSDLPRVIVIGDGLYRVFPSGGKRTDPHVAYVAKHKGP
jgi:hypothetical protein